MPGLKKVSLFFLKAALVYGVLFLPLNIFDGTYENFYRKCNSYFFSELQSVGHVRFTKGKEPATTHINIWNQNQVQPDGKVNSAKADVNTRYRGYLPTILFLSLLLASPVPWKRKTISLVTGFILVTAFVMFKAWLGLVYVCQNNPFLELFNFSGNKKYLVDRCLDIFFHSTGSILYFVVAIWILVTFRKQDLLNWRGADASVAQDTRNPHSSPAVNIAPKTPANKKFVKRRGKH